MSQTHETAIAANPFSITRMLDAPRERVFRAWTEASELMGWFGPQGVTIPACNLDLRFGGTFHYCMRMPNGAELWGKWTFQEIQPPERIVLVSSFSDADGGITRHPFVSEWPLETLSTTTLEEAGEQTVLTITWLPFNAQDNEIARFNAMHQDMIQGWTGTLNQLTAYLATA